MQERDPHRVLHLVGDFVHRVGAQHKQLGAGSLELPRLLGEQLASLVPTSFNLELFDFGEVNRRQHAAGRVPPPESLADQLVDQPVVLRAGLPAHPAEHADHPWPVRGHGRTLPPPS